MLNQTTKDSKTKTKSKTLSVFKQTASEANDLGYKPRYNTQMSEKKTINFKFATRETVHLLNNRHRSL